MYRELLHIYGPIYIHSFGVMIALGLLVFIWLIERHPRFKTMMTSDQFHSILSCAIVAGVVGGRILYVISSWDLLEYPLEVFELWRGGFSILGAVLGIVFVLPWYLRKLNIPVLPFFDLAALHAPIIQSIARIGCFLAGCCYGCPSDLPWAVVFIDPSSPATCGIPLHPTQIYSSLFSLFNFLLMYFVLQYILKKPGQLLGAYFVLTAIDRFTIDFWRADRIYFDASWSSALSMHQWIAIGLFIMGWCMISISSYRYQTGNKPVL
jgi:phosphatidylglycerol---prolipoprotein diacylglyceryl transferase